MICKHCKEEMIREEVAGFDAEYSRATALNDIRRISSILASWMDDDVQGMASDLDAAYKKLRDVENGNAS